MGDLEYKKEGDYQSLVTQISETYSSGFQKTVTAINSNMVDAYWKIGQHIVEFEQGGNKKAEYGKACSNFVTRSLRHF